MTNSLLYADIFFLITAISVVLVAAALVAVLFHVALVIRDVRKISKRVRKESDDLLDNLRKIRETLTADRTALFNTAITTATAFKQVVDILSRKAAASESTQTENADPGTDNAQAVKITPRSTRTRRAATPRKAPARAKSVKSK